ncbi:MAG: hypothetical protein ACI4EO_03715 [Blautia sp.]
MLYNENQGDYRSRLSHHSETTDKYHVESSSVNDFGGLAATEMTGLIYKAPVCSDELDSYKSIYPFSPGQYTED